MFSRLPLPRSGFRPPRSFEQSPDIVGELCRVSQIESHPLKQKAVQQPHHDPCGTLRLHSGRGDACRLTAAQRSAAAMLSRTAAKPSSARA
ncbi:hypothetical protein [Nocardia anaemiae]|uniref:hypothetical protein n=1 Tax=Nocardia anaemiae TaxID=263910 RepID=UPI0012F479D1|nr:hypothetical protein [Nocardia anaemiae]